MRLALIEDNLRLADLIREGLTELGFVVDAFDTIRRVSAALNCMQYDLLILDLGLPDGDGVDFIRSIRAQRLQTPVLIISARDAVEARVRGLDSGADDYIVKPFELSELAARVRALLRRPGQRLGTVLNVANLDLDTVSGMVRVDGEVIDIPRREFSLLEQLMRRCGSVVRRSAIESALYALSAEVTPNALEVAMSRLRKRLAQSGAAVEIHTAHGIGYMLSPATSARN